MARGRLLKKAACAYRSLSCWYREERRQQEREGKEAQARERETGGANFTGAWYRACSNSSDAGKSQGQVMRGNGTWSNDLKHDQRGQHGHSDGLPEPRAFPWCIRALTLAVLHTLRRLAVCPGAGGDAHSARHQQRAENDL